MKYYLLSFSISFFISIVTTPVIIKFSKKHNLFDRPGVRKIHDKPISRIGGVGIFLAFVYVPAALGCYIAVALIWIVPDRRIEKYI